MDLNVHDKIEEIGFIQATAVNIELPSKICLSIVQAGSNRLTNIYLYYIGQKDFVVLFPNRETNTWTVDYYGKVTHVKKRLEELTQQIEKGEI